MSNSTGTDSSNHAGQTPWDSPTVHPVPGFRKSVQSFAKTPPAVPKASSTEAPALPPPVQNETVAEQSSPPVVVAPPRSPLQRISRDTAAGLISLIAHTAVLLVLMLLVRTAGVGGQNNSLMIQVGDSSNDQTNYDLIDMSTVAESNPLNDQREMMVASANNQNVTLSSSVRLGVGLPAAAVEMTSTNKVGSATSVDALVPSSVLESDRGDLFGGFSLDGRSAGKRAELAAANGGGADTEKAVEEAILWLIRHQYKDGCWSTYQDHDGCDCSFNAPKTFFLQSLHRPREVGATGLALLVLLGAGYTHREGPYRDEVYRALQFLINSQKAGNPSETDPRSNGQFGFANNQDFMYEQGIATFALCEAYQMTKDDWLRESCQRGIDYIRAAQCYDGSWGYVPAASGDLSIIGWQMMALRSGAAAGLTVPTTEVRRVDNFLDKNVRKNYRFNYRGGPDNPEMTAIGTMMRLMRGWSPTDHWISEATQYVVFRERGPQDDGPEYTDVYFNYYATNLLFYSNSTLWEAWNKRLKQIYLESQCKEGHEKGSWFRVVNGDQTMFSSPFSDGKINLDGGRLYTTAMAALTLEVYYRILPISKERANIDFKL